MDEATEGLVRAWLIKAQADLGTARKLASGPDAYLDTAIYHCQQAAEKAIKAFLTCHEQRFEKVHHLPLLIAQALSYEEQFDTWMEVAERLTPYATLFRYPGEVLEPELSEFQQALDDAGQFCAFVLDLLPSEVHP